MREVGGGREIWLLSLKPSGYRRGLMLGKTCSSINSRHYSGRPPSRLHFLGGGVQLLSCVQLFVTSWTVVRQTSLSFTISWSLRKSMLTESMTPSNHLILCRPLLLLPSIFPSISVFSSELALHIR